MTRVTWLIPLLFLALASLAAQADAPPTEAAAIAELQRENAALRTRVAELEQELAQLRSRLGTAEARQGDLVAENQRLEELAGMTAKGEAVESSAALIRAEYDDKAGVTTIRSVPEKLEHVAGPLDTPHAVRFSYTYEGQEMVTPPEHVALTIVAAGRPRPKYEHLDEIELSIDGEKRVLRVANAEVVQSDRSPTSRVGLTRYIESVRINLAEDDLIALGRAREATAMLGSVELRFPPDVLATAKAMRERILLGQ